MTTGQFGTWAIWLGLIASFFTMGAYGLALLRPQKDRQWRKVARGGYLLTALGVFASFASLCVIVYNNKYQYDYAFSHTGNDLRALPTDTASHWLFHHWIRFAATWSGQEGSFLLWAFWTALIGFLVFAKAGKYEARVMPFFVSVLTFLCAILIKQSPFHYLTAVHPDMWSTVPPDGQGLTPSLQNYWMTIHPPTIFFGFASLAVPYAYAVAALLWKDYKGWTARVMPYALLTCATLGLGLFMGGYWAYETQGWHGFWAWDPVENASFFPWLAITALVHGLVVQKSRDGMARTNTFLGLFAFWLFLLGTFLTRSGALASKDANGAMLSVHAFDNISKSGLFFMETMLLLYGIGGLVLWLTRVGKMPRRPTTGDTLVSRDFAFFVSIMLMILACLAVTFGTTTPLFMSWMHKRPSQPQPFFYNQVMMPLTILFALTLGCVPWLAWKRTDPEKFLRKLIAPWLIMVGFGFFMIFWVQNATVGLQQAMEPSDYSSTMHYWFNPTLQRVLVVLLSSLGVFVALSNAMLTYRVFRAKPLNAGGWLAHVGMGLLIVGIVVSNTFERTVRVTVIEGEAAQNVYGYKIAMEGMTGKAKDMRPADPSTDPRNSVKLRITPPGVDEGSASSDSAGEAKTFVVEPRWFITNLGKAYPWRFEWIRWPSIEKYLGHDLYVGLADNPQYEWPFGGTFSSKMAFTLKPGEKVDIGGYRVGYYEPIMEPTKLMGAKIVILPIDEKGNPTGAPIITEPCLRIMMPAPDFDPTQPESETNLQMQMFPINEDIPQLKDEDGNLGAIEAIRLDPATKAFSFKLSLPHYRGRWAVPLEVTHKPWVNLVWIGVMVAVSGTLLAMLRRILDARNIDKPNTKNDNDNNDSDPNNGDGGVKFGDGDEIVGAQPWDMPDAPTAPETAMPIAVTPKPLPNKGRLKPAKE